MSFKLLRKKYHIFVITLLIVIPLIGLKLLFHHLNWELLPVTSLHSAIVSGTIFVIGFILSATIADYKESERIPSEFAATLENMYEDAQAVHASYPKFDMPAFQKQLQTIAQSFNQGIRIQKHGTSLQIHKLNSHFIQMEKAGVPANFIVKLKQQQFQLTNRLFRVNYIQRITFIPSATVLARTMSASMLVLLLMTNVEPFYGGLLLTGIIAFIVVYVQRLIKVISVPFQPSGKTMDDVSLFLVDRTDKHLGRASGDHAQ